jgi:hypothetical protein
MAVVPLIEQETIMFTHPDVISTRIRVQVRGSDITTILEVTTSLTLDAMAPDYEADRFNRLVTACVEHWGRKPSAVDRIDVIQGS